MYLPSDGLLQSLTDLSSTTIWKMAFLLSQSGHSHKSPGKHEARYKPVKWAEREDLIICLIEVLAAAMKKKGKPQWYL